MLLATLATRDWMLSGEKGKALATLCSGKKEYLLGGGGRENRGSRSMFPSREEVEVSSDYELGRKRRAVP